jgi:hypothetical protein
MGCDLDEIYRSFVEAIKVQAADFQEKDSGMFMIVNGKYLLKLNQIFYCIIGWALEKILYLEININKFSPLGGSSYIKLPKFIELKGAIINVRNQNECCFVWAITSALFPTARMSTQLSSYPHYSTVLNFTGMNFPVKLSDITKFEEMNNISVNVYGLESIFENNIIRYEVVGPLRYAKGKRQTHVNLLLLTKDCDIKVVGGGDGDNKEHICTNDCHKQHYCWIKDLSRLVSSQVSSDHSKLYFCDGCMSHFKSPAALISHQNFDCKHIFSVTPSMNCKVDKFGKCFGKHFKV